MESYILKNTEESEKVLLYQEKKGYTFSPKDGCYRVKKNYCFEWNYGRMYIER